MSLAPGVRLGPYEVIACIGEGGMGAVWRARHVTLKRDDALKVLPDAFASDVGRLARFEREWQVLASLNHPNIARVYGVERSADTQALVMELVEGTTLADRIREGPIPVADALPMARQIAEALEAAHEQGIIHRDLKPANICIRPDGVVKVLDFGLAKALEFGSSSLDVTASPTITSPAMVTSVGVLLGTAAYMSPEQARGRAADRRSDIWAFGCVLYEMLTGVRAFAGDDVSDTLANVLKVDPDWAKLPREVPQSLRTTLRTCLRKEPKQRLGDMQSVRLALGGAFEAATPHAAAAVVAPGGLWKRRAAIALLAIVVMVLGGIAATLLRPRAVPQTVNRFDYLVPSGRQFRGAARPVMAFSPDGMQFVYNTTEGMFLRRFGELEARIIPGTEAGVITSPFFSPDGQALGFFHDGNLKRIAVSGGAPVVICGGENPFGVTWAADNTILFGQIKGIMRVSANGGTPELLIPAKPNEVLYGPQLLPGGQAVLFSVTTIPGQTRWDQGAIAVQSLGSGERKVVWQGGSDGRYVNSGHLVYAVGAALFAIPFDPATLKVTGGPVSMVQGLSRPSNQAGASAAANYEVSAGGTLVYLTGPSLGPAGTTPNTLVWVDRNGREDPVPAPPRSYVYPRLSPDGSKVALDVRDQQLDIWIWDLARQTLTRLTFDPGEDEFPVWSPDGKRIAFSTTRNGGSTFLTNLFWVAADGTGQVEQLARGEHQAFPGSFSPDATRVVVAGSGTDNNDDIGVVTVTANGGGAKTQVQPLLHTSFSERNPHLSPDGHWMVYESDESGQNEIYVRPFPDVDSGRWQVSAGGGVQPVWARSGRELFYRNGPALMAVPIQTSPVFSAGKPTMLFQGLYLAGPGGPTYDVSPDGRRFLMVKQGSNSPIGAGMPFRFVIVENWIEELKRLVPTN
jgi:eukaryotic-like serine/threonine-protein kinase